MRKVLFFVDGMFMRRRVMERKSFYYGAKEIRQYCQSHLKNDDYLLRIYYYDCAPLEASGVSPLSGREIDFGALKSAQQRTMLFSRLQATPNMALRLGKMEWNGRDWAIVGTKVAPLLKKEMGVEELRDSDIRPHSESAQIEVKMALDMTGLARRHAADLFVLIGDKADLVPALELVRGEGVQICLDPMHAPVDADLSAEADFVHTQLPDIARRPANGPADPGSSEAL